MNATRSYCYDISLPPEFDTTEPIVRVFCEITGGVPPIAYCLPGAEAFGCPGSAPQCDVVHVYIDRGDHADDLLSKLPAWVVAGLRERAIARWIDEHRRD